MACGFGELLHLCLLQIVRAAMMWFGHSGINKRTAGGSWKWKTQKMVRCFSVGGTAQVEQSGDKVRDKIEDVVKKDMQRQMICCSDP